MAKAVEFEIKIKGADGSELKRLVIEAKNVDDALDQITDTAGKVGNSLRQMADKSMVFDAAVKSVETLRDMVGGLAEPYQSFETAMRSVNTMAGKSGEDFDKLTASVVGLSKNIPLAREELANGLYQVISNGVPEDNWIAFLEKSSKAAVGGIANLGETVTVTSTLIKNYGLEWDQAGSIQDKIQMTAKNGVTTFEQLGQALPRVSGSASQLGVSMDELMAVFATTTGVTGNTAEVSTQLAAVLNSLVKPSAEATKAAEAMGIGFNASSIKAAGGLDNFLTGLDASITEYAAKTGQLKETIYGQLFGSAEALRLLGSLTGEQKEKFTQNIGAMAESTGSIDQAFEEMSGTGQSFTVMLKNQIQSMMDWAGSIASTSAPWIEMLANMGLAMMSMVQLSGTMSVVVSWLKALKIGMYAQAAAAKIVTIASNAWKVAQAALNIVLSANPIGIVVMAIAALVAGLIYAYNNCEEFRNICDKVWAVVKELAAAVWDYLVKAFEKVSAVVKKAWEWVKEFFGIKGDGVNEQTTALEKNTKATKENAKAKADAAKNALKGNRQFNSPLDGDSGRKSSGNKDTDKYSGKHLITNASTYKELGNNIQFYQNKLETTKPTETAVIELYSKKIVALKKQQDAIQRMQEAASRPKELTTLKAIDKEIEYQNALRQEAHGNELAAIDKEIERLNALKTALERQAHVDVGVNQITTYRQLEKELQYYTELLKDATAEQRTQIQKQINQLQELKDKWDDTLAELKKPEDISRLGSIEKLDDAISYYQNKQKKASSDEVDGIQRTINELEQKRDAIKRITEVPAMTEEVTKLDGLKGKELRLELKAVGIDGIRKKIKQLQDMLSDTKNPLTDEQRTEVEKTLKSWKNYEKVLRKSDVTLEGTWGNIKGLGGGLSSMTDALQGNRGAWETVTAVVDAAIQIYQGVMGVISIVRALTAVTETATVATTVSQAASTAATTAKVAETPGEVASALTATEAIKVQAMAYRELAASAFMAAHAYIPFAGAGIAAGFIAMMEGLVASVAVTPFANGGIVYGPTLALMGEYSGASRNPEVIAPLDKLRSLIGDGGGGGTVKVVMKQRGRDLVGVGTTEKKINRKWRS